MANKLEGLVDDIYKLLEDGQAEPEDEALDLFAANCREIMKDRLQARTKERKPHLRLSQMGKKPRQIFYDLTEAPGEELRGQTLMKFLYGDLIEEMVLFLVRSAGYDVTDQQKTVTLEDVPGHIDCKINGVLTDVKSTSKFAFKKFKDHTLHENDAFGYINQLANYVTAEDEDGGAFLAVNKETGELALPYYSRDELDMAFPRETIQNHKDVLAKGEEPERCYDAVPSGKSGNMALGINCSYCPFKEHCWRDANGGKGLRTFIYSNRPQFLTEVKKEPRVHEVIK